MNTPSPSPGDPATAAGRDARQRDLVPPDKLAACHAVVVGVGAVGRQVATQLAAVGASRMTLVDHDAVEVANLAPQAYWPCDVGRPKVEATAELCRRANPQCLTEPVAERFRRSTARTLPALAAPGSRPAVFCCVDSIETRRLVWDATRPAAAFYADGRMAAEVIRVLAADRPATDAHYATTLFAAGQAYAGSCTAKSTVYAASVAAGLMLAQFTKWLRGLPVDRDVSLNLLSAELAVA